MVSSFVRSSRSLLGGRSALHFGELSMNHLFSLVLGVFVATIGVNGLATVIDKFVSESRVVLEQVDRP